ncbi:MAG: chemotaxis protein CheC [Hungatella sp.]|jgi:chemotaxis protein CheC|nr:chemotaxis protein CheC [Hungatella sp.]
MRLKKYEDMNLQELDVMKEISSIGTSHAATALSKLLQREIRISIPEINILGYEETVDRLGYIEELVTATLVRMSNEIDGLMLFVFKMDLANAVLGKLIGMEYQSFEELDELAYSALEEVGNIIICSYVNAFTQLVGVQIDLSVPSSTVNMLGGVLTVPMAEYGYVTDKLMYINAEFIVDGEKLSDGLLMLPDIESLNRILEKLGVS